MGVLMRTKEKRWNIGILWVVLVLSCICVCDGSTASESDLDPSSLSMNPATTQTPNEATTIEPTSTSGEGIAQSTASSMTTESAMSQLPKPEAATTSSSSSVTSQTTISPSPSTATEESSSIVTSPLPEDHCVNNSCVNGGVCMNVESNYTCNCTSGWTGWLCDQDKDDCEPDPCKNNGTCVDNGTNSFICNCTTGWQGLTCAEDVDECASHPCVNGTCDHGLGTGTYNCSCDVDFEGTNCDKVIDSCESSPCKHNGNCTDGIGDFTCNCTTGWMGKTCEEDVKECDVPDMCLNGGYCKEGFGNYSCLCENGWTGDRCEEDIDECKDHCKGTGYNCTNTNGSYICQCESGYMNSGLSGKINCEEIMLFPDKADSMRYMMKGQMVGPIMLNARVPVFNTFFTKLYVSMNGYLTFGDKYERDYPPKNISDWTGASMIKMVAPYWWYNDVPENGSLSISHWRAENQADKEMIDKVSNIVNFTAELLVMATWDKFTPHPSAEFSHLKAKFQVVIATDGRQSTAVFNYDNVWEDSMDRQPATLVRSSTVKQLEKPGKNKRFVEPLFENGQKMDNTDFVCARELAKLPTQIVNASFCPCTIQQAEHDFQYNTMSDDADKKCFLNLFPVGSSKNFRQWCCYEKKFNSLIDVKEKTAGYGVLVNSSLKNMQDNAYVQCCGPMSSKCMAFYDRYPAASCQMYKNLLALSWGDPHFHRLDSATQTFNGFGEYQFLNLESSDFKAQIRTDRVTRTDGEMANATVIVHLAIKHGVNSVELMAKDETLEVYLNGMKTDTSSNSDENMHLMKDGKMVKASFSNGISFLVMPFKDYMSISASMMSEESITGLIGNTGTSENMATESQFFEFGQKYLVQNESMSIFNYSLQSGNFSSNQHPDFTPTFYRDLSLDELFDNDTKVTALSLCGDVKECFVDYAVTNNTMFANNTKMEYHNFMDRKDMFMNVSEEAMTYRYPAWKFTTNDINNLQLEQKLELENAEIDTNISTMYYTFNSTSGMFTLNVSHIMSDWSVKFVSGKTTIRPTIHVCRCKEASECLPVPNTVSDQIVDQSCNCSANHEGHYCQTDIDVCYKCYGTAVCNSTNQDSPCTCPEGMKGNGIHCYDVDECKNTASNECDQICYNFIGGYNCSCRSGFNMEGKGTCKDINECATSNLNNCTEREFCSNKPGTYQCTCKAQYKKNPESGVCEKIDVIYGGFLVFDSTVGDQKWSPKLEDKNSNEFKKLASIVEKAVKEAFKKSSETRDGLVAVTVTKFSLYDQSSRRKRAVDSKERIQADYEVAFNKPISDTDLNSAIYNGISCNPSCNLGEIIGVQKDESNISVNYDRCQIDVNHNCQMSSTKCISVNGTFSCVCKEGFKPWDLADNACEDKDECVENNSTVTELCGAGGVKCVNTPGSYTCDCNPDHEFDVSKKKCTLVNHCKSSPCVHGQCMNAREEPYACKCEFGYTGQKCDGEDKDALRQRTTIIAVSATLGVLCFLLIIAVCYMYCKSSRKKSSQHSISMEEYTKFKGLPRAHLSGHENAMMENETNGDYRQSHEL